MTSTTTTGRFASYFDQLAPGDPVDLDALLGFHRARYGDSAMEETGGDDQTGKDDAGKDDDKGKDKDAESGKDDDGKDDDDPPGLGEAGQRALRKERDARKAAEKAAKDDRAELERLRKATQTETEKALADAKAEGAAEARKQLQPSLVMAEFRAASSGRLDADRLEDLTEDIDLTRFLTEDGKVDAKKVAKKVDAWAPKKDERRPGSRRDPSQGARGSEAKGGDGGRAEAQRRWPTKK